MSATATAAAVAIDAIDREELGAARAALNQLRIMNLLVLREQIEMLDIMCRSVLREKRARAAEKTLGVRLEPEP